MRTAIQLWTLRDHRAPLPDVLDRIAAAGYDGVEFAGLGDPGETDRALDEAGLLVAGTHVDADDLRADPDGIDADLETIESPYVVVPYLGDDHFVDAAAVRETGEELDALARETDHPLLYHNHDHEFVPVGNETAYDRLVAATTVDFELDVGWAHAAGRDPVDLLERFGDRIPVVHLKDVTADGEPTLLGDGVVDLDRVVAAAAAAGTDWLVFEHDEPDDPMAAMEAGAEAMRDLLAEHSTDGR